MAPPERLVAETERVRQAYRDERKIRRLDAKIRAGHVNLEPMRARLVARMNRTGGAA